MSVSDTMLKAFLDLHAPLKDYGKMRLIQDAWKARDGEIEALRQELAAIAKENERLQGVCHDYRTTQETMVGKLVASQAREAKLREALEHIHPDNIHDMERRRKALAISADDSALQERLKQERERCATIAEETAAGRDAEAIAYAIRTLT